MNSVPAARRPWLIGLLVLALTLAVFQRVGHQGYVNWDDAIHVYDDPHLGSWAGVGYVWRHFYGGLYIPLSYTAYSLVALAARLPHPLQTPELGWTGFNPHTFHQANLALHLLNTLLVFLILRRLLRRDWPAGAGALLFGIHPLQVESVAWISEMRGLLSGFFSLLAVWLWIQRQPRSWALSVGATAAFGAALLCKPSAVTVPLVVLALDLWVRRRPWRQCLPPMLGWMVLSLALLWVTRVAQPLPYAVTLSLWTRPVVAADALWFYLSHLAWPARLGPDYGRTPTWVMRHSWVTGIVPAALTVLLWQARRRTPLFAAGAVFAAGLLPVLGLVPFAFQWYSTVADRYLYLAMLGPALALGWAMSRCEFSRGREMATAFCLVALAALGLRSVAQVRTWDNALTFTANAVATNPQSWVMHYNRGHYFERHGDDREAAAEYQRALAANPAMADAEANLGGVLLRQGHHAEADAALNDALRLDPTLTEARDNLGLSLADQGRTTEAVAQWQRVAQAWPQSGAVRYNLGTALLKLGRAGDAAAEFQEALRLQPRFAEAQAALALARRQTPHGPNAVPPTRDRS